MGAIRTLAVAAIAAATIPIAAEAATITQVYNYEMPLRAVGAGAFNQDYLGNQSIQPFDTGLGELTGVRITSTGLAHVSLSLGPSPDFCLQGLCFSFDAEGNSTNALQSAFMIGGSTLWSAGDGANLHVSKPGQLDADAALEYSFDQNFTDPAVLGWFGGGSGILGMQYKVSMIGLFDDYFDRFEHIATSSAWFATTVTYEYTKPGGTTPGAVPEPSTWAMMVLGFGLVGGGLRRRRGVRRAFAV